MTFFLSFIIINIHEEYQFVPFIIITFYSIEIKLIIKGTKDVCVSSWVINGMREERIDDDYYVKM